MGDVEIKNLCIPWIICTWATLEESNRLCGQRRMNPTKSHIQNILEKGYMIFPLKFRKPAASVLNKWEARIRSWISLLDNQFG
jgi:hypothetical protein